MTYVFTSAKHAVGFLSFFSQLDFIPSCAFPLVGTPQVIAEYKLNILAGHNCMEKIIY